MDDSLEVFPYESVLKDDTTNAKIEVVAEFKLDTVSIKKGIKELDAKVLITSFDSGSYKLPLPLFIVNPHKEDVYALKFDTPVLSVNTIQVDTTGFVPMDIKGQIKYPYHRSVYGIGYFGNGKYSARANNQKTEEYSKWFSMFVRCYDEKFQEKQPTYIGCSVSDDFCNFQNFAEWYNKNKYECRYPLELDKDFLYEGNKEYSPSTCCLIPKEINSLINWKRHDKAVMKRLYDKYKEELPYYLRMELYKLTVSEQEVA